MEINKRIVDYKVKEDKVIGVIKCKRLGTIAYDSVELKEQLLLIMKTLDNAFKSGSLIQIPNYPTPQFGRGITKEERTAVDVFFIFLARNIHVIKNIKEKLEKLDIEIIRI